jgi:hypothetical protein
MRTRARRIAIWATTIALALAVLTAPTLRAQDPALDEALCQLWSADEVARVVGGEVQPEAEFGSCAWTPPDSSGPWMALNVSWWDETLRDQESISVDGHEVPVGTVTAWYEDLTDTLYLPYSDGLLSIAVQPAYSVDRETGAVTLGELALSRSAPLPAPPTAPPPTATEVAFCALWSADEVAQAVGGQVKAVPGLDGCFWFSSDTGGPSVSASVSWDSWTLDSRSELTPDGHQVTVGSVSGWYDDLFGLWVPVEDGLLSVSASAAPGLDSETAAVSLAELALSRSTALPAAPSPYPTEEPLPSQTPTPVSALAEEFCTLLTTDEVGRELGADVEQGTLADSCYWSGADDTGSLVSWYVGWGESSLDEMQAAFPNGRLIGLGSVTGWYEPEFGMLSAPVDGGRLAMGIDAAPDVDQLAAARTLAGLVISRSASLPPRPTPAPTERPTTDPELEDMLPETIGGEWFGRYSTAGAQFYADAPEAMLRPLTDALGALGKTLDDVSKVHGSTKDFRTRVDAIRIRGADVAQVVPQLLVYWFGDITFTETPGSVAGKTVTVLTSSGGASWYVYRHGDTMWIVAAEEPNLSELLGALP